MTTKASATADRVLVEGVIDELRMHLEVIKARREELQPGSFDEDLTATAASLGKVLLAGAAERRQQRKAILRELGQFSLEELVAHLRALPAEEREHVARALSGEESQEPLL